MANSAKSAVASSGGSGDVVGPAAATTTAVPKFSDTTGKLLSATGIKIDASNNLQIPIASTIIYGGFTGGSTMWIAGGGPAWSDSSLGVVLRHDIQSLTADRDVTWPNVAGTVVVGSASGTTVGAAGAASVLPVAPLGYLTITLPSGVAVKIPYYTS